MKPSKIILIATLFASMIASCAGGGNKTGHQGAEQMPPRDLLTDTLLSFDINQKIDYNQDLSGKSLQDLRLLRNELLAKRGYCFMQADLRGYFSAYMKGYDSMMEARFYAEDSGNTKAFPPLQLTGAEDAFSKKIEALEAEKLKHNFIDRNGTQMANVDNIVNLFQFRNISKDFLSLLDKNNFAIVPGDEIQLFHVYEKSDYHQIPNFVTTDLYLQLYHMYFSYVLRSLEQRKFIPTITELTDGMYTESIKTASVEKDESIKSVAEYSAVFYAIPYYILTGTKKPIPAKYKAMFEQEITNINNETDTKSEFLESKAYFGYSLFKPRGHYTRTDTLKKYFKAMMWVQTASFCRETPEQLKRSIFMAYMLNTGKSTPDHKLLDLYNSIYEPIVFLIGEPDNLSVNDLVAYLKRYNAIDLNAVMRPSTQANADAYLQEVAKNRNTIKPKIRLSCQDKINFMPQRYLFDNEILQTLTDVKPNAKRAYPKGLDVFATLGNKAAEDILLNDEKEGDNWAEYPKKMDTLEAKFANYQGWNKTVYNKWMYTLKLMQQRNSRYPNFMQTNMWDRKNLNTSLASWTDLKHDAILYGEQPQAAECGGGGPPDPYTVGYVEPNVNFWKSMTELLSLTDDVLKRNGLQTEDISSKTKELNEITLFLLSASEKELKHQKLSEEEYHTIEVLGASTEYLTLSIIDPDKHFDHWEDLNGPDKSVAVVADVYTRNVPDCNKNGILHEGVGGVNEIYVVVEIEGYLYLTKGAMFSYYEFVQPLGTRLTDEEWQKMLESKKNLPAIPEWMKDLILPPTGNVPKDDEKVTYSSGC